VNGDVREIPVGESHTFTLAEPSRVESGSAAAGGRT
jgi:hypothetical protein